MKDNRWAMLCKLRVQAFNDPLWRWERKLDGCRMRVDIDEHMGIGLTARSGADKTAQFPDVVQAIALTCKWEHAPMILDGELVSAAGLSFQEFNQRRMNRTEDIARIAVELPASLVLFDVLSAGGRDMEPLALSDRLEVLANVRPAWCKLPEASADGIALFERAKAEGWEGVVGKRLDEPYMPHRRNWVKVKSWIEQTFWCTGFSYGIEGKTGKRFGKVGAIALAEEGTRRVSMCGTGPMFSDANLEKLTARCKANQVTDAYEPGVHGLRVPWLVRIKYCERTNEGSLRFPVYLGDA